MREGVYNSCYVPIIPFLEVPVNMSYFQTTTEQGREWCLKTRNLRGTRTDLRENETPSSSCGTGKRSNWISLNLNQSVLLFLPFSHTAKGSWYLSHPYQDFPSWKVRHPNLAWISRLWHWFSLSWFRKSMSKHFQVWKAQFCCPGMQNCLE